MIKKRCRICGRILRRFERTVCRFCDKEYSNNNLNRFVKSGVLDEKRRKV